MGGEESAIATIHERGKAEDKMAIEPEGAPANWPYQVEDLGSQRSTGDDDGAKLEGNRGKPSRGSQSEQLTNTCK